jgi:hypothetical protein
MRIGLIRDIHGVVSTQGILFVNNVHVGYTLEPQMGFKQDFICEKGCIPAGEYKVISTYSEHFKEYKPMLVDVPGYEGILIHEGNTTKDTRGCILVGKCRTTTGLSESMMLATSIEGQVAFAQHNDEDITILITNDWSDIDEHPDFYPSDLLEG